MTNKLYLAFLISITSLIALLFYFAGVQYTLVNIWNIPLMFDVSGNPYYFVDIDKFTKYNSIDFEYYMQNSKEILPLINYPRIWEYLAIITNLKESDRYYFGVFNISLFYIGFIIFSLRIQKDVFLSILLLSLYFSPSSVLLMERGQPDMILFFIISMSLAFINRPYIFSSAILFASLLKFFPILSLVGLLKYSMSVFIKYFIVVLMLFGIYIWYTFSDILIIMDQTVQSASSSYGKDVLWSKLMEIYKEGPFTTFVYQVKYIIYLYLICSFLLIYALIKYKCKLINLDITYIDEFRVGSSLYIGTFLLINNFDYRLVFLIFTIPQLYLWSYSNNIIIKTISITSIISIVYTMWYSVLNHWLGRMTTLFDELSNIILFSMLLFFFVCTLPSWLLKILKLTDRKLVDS